MNKLYVSLSLLCALFYFGTKADDLLNTGSISDPGYCSPYIVTCNDGTQFMGKAVSREDRLGKSGARQCDFVSPGKGGATPRMKHTRRHVKDITRPEVWAGAVCFGHEGIKTTQQPFFNSYSRLLPLINAEENKNSGVYRAIMEKNREGRYDAQAAYDEFLRLKVEEYYMPIAPVVGK